MKLQTLLLCAMLALSTGCATKEFDLGDHENASRVCGQDVKVALEEAAAIETNKADCEEIKKQARSDHNENDFMIQILGYVVGYLIGSLLW